MVGLPRTLIRHKSRSESGGVGASIGVAQCKGICVSQIAISPTSYLWAYKYGTWIIKRFSFIILIILFKLLALLAF